MKITQRQYSPVARAYATALVRSGLETGRLDALDGQGRALAEAIARAREAVVFLDSPQANTEDKLEYLDKVFRGRIDPPLKRMLELLVLRARVGYLAEILDLFGDLVQLERGIGQAVVMTARPLDQGERRRLRQTLERHTRARLNIDWGIDPALLGGVAFRFRDLLIDSTLRTGLDQIRGRLFGAKVLANEQ